jgi:hypothetical protein
MAQLIADALRASLRRREHVEHRRRVIPMPGMGTPPGIDLDNRHSLLQILDRCS